jgi:hypothetical protein
MAAMTADPGRPSMSLPIRPAAGIAPALDAEASRAAG